REYCGANKLGVAGERDCEKGRLLQWPESDLVFVEPCDLVSKERRIEADIFVNVVVHAVVEDAVARTNNCFLIAKDIPGHTKPGCKVVQVLVPDARVPYLRNG